MLGGYYLIDVADLDEALAVAKAVPAPSGGIEVRPIWPADEPELSIPIPVEAAVAAAVAEAHRREWAQVLATTVRVTGDIDLAEECIQDAYAKALATWATSGVPAHPGAWLTTVARRKGP